MELLGRSIWLCLVARVKLVRSACGLSLVGTSTQVGQDFRLSPPGEDYSDAVFFLVEVG